MHYLYLHHKQAKSLCKRPAFLFEYFYDQQDTRPNLLTLVSHQMLLQHTMEADRHYRGVY